MGLRRSWSSFGATTCRAHGGGGGEGDSTGGPRPGHGKDDWPTLVIESGHSESMSYLHLDMQWWFAASQHQVKIVLLAKFDRSQQAILLERWEEEAPPPRPGATTTRQAAALQALLRQQITITKNTTSPVSYHVTGGDMVLPFHLLFRRAPGPQESDLIISIQDLEEYADVWEVI